MTHSFAILISRVAALFLAAAILIWPLATEGQVGWVAYVLAAPFVLAAVAPRTLGPMVGMAVMVVATLTAFYDPPSSVGFFPGRLAFALPLFAVGFALNLPKLF
jgi:hypothetical protein